MPAGPPGISTIRLPPRGSVEKPTAAVFPREDASRRTLRHFARQPIGLGDRCRGIGSFERRDQGDELRSRLADRRDGAPAHAIAGIRGDAHHSASSEGLREDLRAGIAIGRPKGT
jgi:hypothetical protein